MAGPVYLSKRYPASTRLPDHYDGRLSVYEWIRGWIIRRARRETMTRAPRPNHSPAGAF